MFYKEIIGVKLRHTKHTITQSQQNVNHLLLHLAERTLADRTEMVQLTHTHTHTSHARRKRTVFGIRKATIKTIRHL